MFNAKVDRANIIEFVRAHVEKGLAENKSTFKTYQSQDSANARAGIASDDAAEYFSMYKDRRTAGCRFVVVQLQTGEFAGRWVYALDFTELLSRKDVTGGYIGILPGILKF